MNIHKIQSVQGGAEVDILMRAASHLVTSQRNAPIAGIVQDGLIAAYKLSNTWKDGTETMISREIVFDCIMGANISMKHYNKTLSNAERYYPQYIHENKLEKKIPGKLLLSFLLPSRFKYYSKDEKDKRGVRIENGCILPQSGPLCKQTIGSKGGSIIHVLWKNYSAERALKFLTQTQFLTDTYIGFDGFSMGLSDCVLESNEEIKDVLNKLKEKVQPLLLEDNIDVQEAKINAELSSAINIGTTLVCKHMNKGDKNSVSIMKESGAKGSTVNMTHKMGFIGQQTIEGKRIPLTLCRKTRALPIFKSNDNSPLARGFVFNNYTNGLSPGELYHHASAGRDGIVSICCRTAESGYANKCANRKMDDCVVEIDGTVKNSSKGIVQYLYGDFGLSPKKMVHVGGYGLFFVNPQDIANKVNSEVCESLEEPVPLTPLDIDDLCLYIRAGYPSIITPVTDLATSCLRDALKHCLIGVKVYPSLISLFKAEIIDAFEKSKIQHGDAVGLIGSLSIGEPTTQLSIPSWEKVVIRHSDFTIIGNIGDIIDDILNAEKDDSTVIKLFTKKEYSVPTVKVDRTVEWGELSGVVRHLSDGEYTFVKTASGRGITTTCSHAYIINRQGVVDFVKASELRIGDTIPLFCKNLEEEYDHININNTIIPLTFELGWIVGSCLFNSYEEPFKTFIRDMPIECSAIKMCISRGNFLNVFLTSSRQFKVGLLRFFFDKFAVNINGVLSVYNIQFPIPLDEIILVLHSLGIGVKYSEYEEMIIASVITEHTRKYFELVGSYKHSIDSYKVDQSGGKEYDLIDELDNIPLSFIFECTNKPLISRKILQLLTLHEIKLDVIWDEIREVNIYKSSREFVYDFIVEGNNTFMLANGLFTHNTLNTARLAGFGEKDVSIGVPRLCEILNVTQSKHQKHPSCKVYTKSKPTFEEINTFKRTFECITIKNVISNYQIEYCTPTPKDGPIKILKYNKFNPGWWFDCFLNLKLASVQEMPDWVIKLEFDYKRLCDLRISLEQISNCISAALDFQADCIYSPHIIGQIYVIPNFNYFQECIDKKHQDVLSTVMNQDNFQFFVCRDFLKEYIKAIKLCGIDGIEKLRFDKSGEYFETKGTNLIEILSFENIDFSNTTSNDIWEIYNVLGIEATKKYMFQEITRVISFDGTYVNPCHLQQLIDCMTRNGIPTSTKRYGISREVGPVAKLSFEQPVENSTEAAIFTEGDFLVSSAASVMCGLVNSSGTGVSFPISADQLPVV